jgi:hypothetical protein
MAIHEDLMMRSVLSRLEYWSAQAADAKRANDSEREALCRRSIDEYSVLIQTVIARAADAAAPDVQGAPGITCNEF